jgi:hypothetical protein
LAVYVGGGTQAEDCEDAVLRICGAKRMRQQRSGEDYIRRSFMLCTPHQILFE